MDRRTPEQLQKKNPQAPQNQLGSILGRAATTAAAPQTYRVRLYLPSNRQIKASLK